MIIVQRQNINQQNRVENPEKKMIFFKASLKCIGGKAWRFDKRCWSNWVSVWKKATLDPGLISE